MRRGQKLAPFFRQAQAAGGAVKQAHAQMRFQLHQQLARCLRRDALRGGGLPQAAQLGRLHKVGDGTQFVDGHGGDVALIGKQTLLMNQRIMG
ncbi:hypothetical protein D3C87_1821170 [compost metagenome]